MNEESKELSVRLESKIGKLFKILALYEEKERGIRSTEEVEIYVDSLIFSLEGFKIRFALSENEEFEELLDILTAIKEAVLNIGIQPVIKRESFKCIDIIHSMNKKVQKQGDISE